jgi:MoaA/NifB/PqqE/SkfB family radical SAM enzyme
MNKTINDFLTYYINKFYLHKMKVKNNISYYQIYITHLCSEACRHCYLKEEKIKDPTTQEIMNTLNNIINNNNLIKKNIVIDLIGGDPLLRNDIFEILDFLKNNNINYGIKGNPQLIIKYKDILKDFKLQRYQLSLDGLEQTHDSIRSNGSFKETISAIKILNQLHIPVFLKYTVFKENIEEIPLLLNYLYDNNLIIAGFSTSRYYEKDLEKTLSKNEMKYFMEKSFNSYVDLYTKQIENKKINISIVFKEHLWYPFLYKKGYILNETHNILSKNFPFSITCSMLSENCHIIEIDGSFGLCPKIDKINLTNHTLEKYKKNLKEISCADCIFKKVCLGCPAFYNINNIDFTCFLYTKGDS